MAIFTDGFESNDFTAWTDTYTSVGETATTGNTNPHHGIYHAIFTCNGSTAVENAYAYYTLASSQAIIYARGYFSFDSLSSLNVNGEYWTVIVFRDDAGNDIAECGVRNNGVDTLWYFKSYISTAYSSYYGTHTPSPTQYYCVEFYIKIDNDVGEAYLWIDGVEEASVTGQDNNYRGDVDSVRMGTCKQYNKFSSSLDMDCCVIDSSRILCEGGAPPEVTVLKDSLVPRAMPQLINRGFYGIMRKMPMFTPRTLI